MTKIESAETFAVDRLGVPEDCRRLAGSLIEARDNAVANAARLEVIDRLLGMRHAQVPYPLREYLQSERGKYIQPKEPGA